MNRETISAGIGGIDDVYIEQALNFADEKRKNVFRLRLAFAACVVAIIFTVPITLQLSGIFNSSNSPIGEGDELYAPTCVGQLLTFEKGWNGTTLYYKSYEDGKVTIVLNKADEYEIRWYLKGKGILREYNDANGKPQYDLTQYYATTSDSWEVDGTLVENGFVFYVNGIEQTTFPTAPGEYEITIDYTALAEYCDILDPYIICSYGALGIGEYAYVKE